MLMDLFSDLLLFYPILPGPISDICFRKLLCLQKRAYCLILSRWVFLLNSQTSWMVYHTCSFHFLQVDMNSKDCETLYWKHWNLKEEESKFIIQKGFQTYYWETQFARQSIKQEEERKRCGKKFFSGKMALQYQDICEGKVILLDQGGSGQENVKI